LNCDRLKSRPASSRKILSISVGVMRKRLRRQL
jgi:hypothetical protein